MIKAFALLTIVICFFSHSAYCKIGVTTSNIPPTATLKCFVSQGMTNFLYLTEFPRQKTINQDLFKIKNAGMSVDLLYIICQERNPTQEVKQFLKSLLPGLIDRIWLVIIYSCGSYDNPARTVQLLTEYANQFTFSKYKTGIAANQYYWQKLTLNTSLLNNFQLFWDPQNKDNKPNFDDYIPFGGWKKPTVKSFTYTQSCGIYVRLYYEQ